MFCKCNNRRYGCYNVIWRKQQKEVYQWSCWSDEQFRQKLILLFRLFYVKRRKRLQTIINMTYYYQNLLLAATGRIRKTTRDEDSSQLQNILAITNNEKTARSISFIKGSSYVDASLKHWKNFFKLAEIVAKKNSLQFQMEIYYDCNLRKRIYQNYQLNKKLSK